LSSSSSPTTRRGAASLATRTGSGHAPSRSRRGRRQCRPSGACGGVSQVPQGTMMGHVDTDLLTRARAAFDLGDGDVSLAPGARGALGQMWRLTVRDRVYALKQAFSGAPPTQAEVGAELAFAKRAASSGVRLPGSHADRNGRYLVPLPAGGWLRLYEWVDVR